MRSAQGVAVPEFVEIPFEPDSKICEICVHLWLTPAPGGANEKGRTPAALPMLFSSAGA